MGMVPNLGVPKMRGQVVALLAQLQGDYLVHCGYELALFAFTAWSRRSPAEVVTSSKLFTQRGPCPVVQQFTELCNLFAPSQPGGMTHMGEQG